MDDPVLFFYYGNEISHMEETKKTSGRNQATIDHTSKQY